MALVRAPYEPEPRGTGDDLRTHTWHIPFKNRFGKNTSKSTKIKHDGKMKNGAPVPPQAVWDFRKAMIEEMESGLEPNRKTETLAMSLDNLLVETIKNEDAWARENGGWPDGKKKPSINLRSNMKHLKAYFKDLTLVEITQRDYEGYRDWRRQGGGAADERFDQARAHRRPVKDCTTKNQLKLVWKLQRKAGIQVSK